MNTFGQITYTGLIEPTSCGVCGVHFGMQADMLRKCRDTGAEFYCPNGHRLVFRQTEAEKLRDQLAAAKGREDQLRARVTSLDGEVEHQRKRVQGYQGALTKVKKRVGNGVCPCCQRTFKDLARHMGTQHPDYSGEGAP